MAKSNSPVIADLEIQSSNTASIAKDNPIEDIANGINILLDKEPDQNTKITAENEEGLIGIDVLQAHMKASFGYEFPSLIALKKSKQDHALSVGGFRFEKIIEIFKNIQTSIISGETSLRNRLLGR
jgi:hypothetical protein